MSKQLETNFKVLDLIYKGYSVKVKDEIYKLHTIHKLINGFITDEDKMIVKLPITEVLKGDYYYYFTNAQNVLESEIENYELVDIEEFTQNYHEKNKNKKIEEIYQALRSNLNKEEKETSKFERIAH